VEIPPPTSYSTGYHPAVETLDGVFIGSTIGMKREGVGRPIREQKREGDSRPIYEGTEEK
jgi:hypothetical protein